MKKRRLGGSDLEVSEVAFGCMSMGDQPKQIDRLLRKAVDQGINLFDTADLYDRGMNELHVGTSLKPIRQDILLATKVGNQWKADGTGWNWNPGKDYILEAVNQSLRRLQTDYIDLYQLHGGTLDDPMEETIEAFEQLVKEGKIRYYGISSIRPDTIRAYTEQSAMQSVMMQYSLLDPRPEEAMLQFLETEEISVLARGVFAQGLLLNKESKAYLQYSSGEVTKASRLMTQLAEAKGVDKEATALAYVLTKAQVASAVIGIRTEEQLDGLLAGYKHLDKIQGEDFQSIREELRTIQYEKHR